MKHPPGLLDIQGKPGKGHVVLTVGKDDVPLEEFGTWTEGNQTSCYALTSPGDVVTIRFAFNPGVGDFVDLLIDGIRRGSTANSYLLEKHFKGVFQRVCCQARIAGTERRAGMKSCEMVVRERLTQKDITLAVGPLSTVGTLQLQIFRKGPSSRYEEEDQHAASEEPSGLAERAPSFIDHATWSELSCNISSSGPPPPFEIGFINEVPVGKTLKARLSKEWSAEYKLWGVYTFHLRSTADLQALGFENVPTYYSPPSSPSKPIKNVCIQLLFLSPECARQLHIDVISHSRVERLISQATMCKIEISKAPDSQSNGGLEEDETSDELAELFLPDEEPEEDHIIESTEQTAVKLPETSSTQTAVPGLLECMANNRREILGDVEDDHGIAALLTSSGSEVEAFVESTEVPVSPPSNSDMESDQPLQTEETVVEIATEIDSEEGGDHLLLSHSSRKSLILPGLKCAPAHQAWLERCSPENAESRSASPEELDLSQILREELCHEDSRDAFGDDSTPSAMSLDVHRQFIQSPGFYAHLNRGIYGSISHYSMQNSQDEHPTLPRSSSEPPVKPERRNSDSFALSTINIDKANRPTGSENSSRSPKPILENCQNNRPTSSQLQSVSVEDDRIMNDDSPLDAREMLRQARASAIAKRVADQAHSHSTRRAREITDAPSIASVKVVDSTEFEGSTTLGFRTKSGSPDKAPKFLLQGDNPPNEAINPEPLLRSISNSDAMLLKSRSALSPGIVAQQVRIHWEERPPTPIVPALNRSPTLSQRSLTQGSGTPSSSQIRVGNQNCLLLTSPTPIRATRGLLSHHQPVMEKRKAESISGESHSYSDLASSPSRKTSIAPALRKAYDTGREMETIRARIAAAEQRRPELEEKHKAALRVKQEKDKVKELVEKAEQLERENAELEAQIAAIYDENSY